MSRRALLTLAVLVVLVASIGFEASNVGAQFRMPGIPGIPGLSRSQPEESSMDMFRAFEDKYKFLKLLDKSTAAQGIKVFIGSENPFFEMQECSLVVGNFQAGNAVGTLGVIGPVRMQYRQVINAVDYTSRLLSRILDERLKKGIDG